MKQLAWLLMLCCVSGTALADGKQLHDGACMQCHASLNHGDPYGFYTRSKHIVKSLAELDKRVKYCEVAADVKWTAAQRKQVVDYLNKAFYHF